MTTSLGASKSYCEVDGCGQTASRCMAAKEEISHYLHCTITPSEKQETHFCDQHYRDPFGSNL